MTVRRPPIPELRSGQLRDLIEERASHDGGYAVAYALLQLADAQKATAHWLQYLGNGSASTHHGALEAFGMHIGEKLDAMAEGITELAIALGPKPP
jgi:hypothetical protein